jgi:hypothetical protein
MRGLHDLVQDALEPCSRNPGNYRLMTDTAMMCQVNRDDPYDMDMTASLWIRCLASKAMPGVERGDRPANAATELIQLGYADHTMAVLRQGEASLSRASGTTALVYALLESGQLRDLIEAAEQHTSDGPAQAIGGLCCALLGDRRGFDAIDQRAPAMYRDTGVALPLSLLLDSSSGARVDMTRLAVPSLEQGPDQRQFLVVAGLAIALQQNERLPNEGAWLTQARTMVQSRMVTYLLSTYESRWPDGSHRGLAELWQWWHPADPINRVLMAQVPQGASRLDLAAVERALADMPEVPSLPEPALSEAQALTIVEAVPPAPFAYELRRLCDAGQDQRAMALAWKYVNASHRFGKHRDWSVLAMHLVHTLRKYGGAAVPPGALTMR